MPDYSNDDTRIYGAEAVNPHEPARLAEQAAAQYTAPVAVPASTVVQGSALLAQGEANLRANNREKASVVASIGAGMTQWSAVHLYEYLKTPDYVSDPEFKAADFMRNNVDFRLEPMDEQHMLKAKNAEDAAARMEVLRSRNQAYEAMGDHGVASFLTGALDPGYLAIDIASLGTTRVLRGGKLLAGGTTLGATAVATAFESEYTPMSTTELVLNAMGNAAATGMFYRNGQLVPRDPDFPAPQLRGAMDKADPVEPAGLSPEVPDPITSAPALTTSRVPATGQGTTPVKYSDGSTGGEYNPALGLSRTEQEALTADGRVLQVQSVADIANHAKSVQRGHTVIDADAKAVYLPDEDRVFLIKDNIKEGDDVKGIMLHEYGVHMNAERVLGTKTLGEMLDRLEDLALSGNARAKQAYADVPANTPQHLVREEALGYYVERNHNEFKDTFVSRFIAGVRASLRKSGLMGLKLSENDIVQLVRKAAKGGEKAKKVSFDATFPMAWHGSPVRGFDAMKTEFMGTGEGVQAFGWGHYVTSEKGTALDYRNKESARRGKAPEDGGLYRVKINATEDQFLDLDARVQSPTVTAALTALGVREGVTGKAAYDWLTKTLGGQRAASEALYSAGVAGNRYSTGRTRMRDVRSSNFVLFNDSAVDVTARYSKGLAAPTHTAAVKKAMGSKEAAKAIEWSWHKTFSRYGGKAAEVADLLMDNPLKHSSNSAASIQRALRGDLSALQYAYEGLLLEALAKRGAGLAQRIFQPAKAVKVQQGIERDLYREMLRRDRLSRDGVPLTHAGVDPDIKAMADALDAVTARSLKEMQAAGVAGAGLVTESAGYITRRWDIAKLEAIEAKMKAHGPVAPEYIRQQIVDTISIGIQRANGWAADISDDIAGAIYDRTKRKGMFQDSDFRAEGVDGAEHLRSILSAEGLGGARLDRVMGVLAGKADEAGKMPTLKARVDMHMDETLTLPDGSTVAIMDMLDTNVSAITERYLDTVSARAAMARKGLTSPSDIQNLRKQLAQSIPDVTTRAEAMKSFDEALNVLQGLPVGEDMLSGVRNMQALTQMVGLAKSGLWQLTEYATIMAQYGAASVIKEMVKELPYVRNMVKHEAASLREVLARNSAQDTRLRPFINRMEDNFEVPMSDSVKLALQQAKQLVPYANAMKFIQRHQARVSANLIVDTMHRAAKGDNSAIKSLEAYGLESGSMVKVSADIRTHGMDTSKWSNATWQEVREPLTRMMDDAVLRARLGEVPQFAHTSTLGKFLFTFRSFTLAAHNKVLANTLSNGGYAGVSLLLMYQMPLTVLASAAGTALEGKKQHSLEDTVKQALNQVGAFGLFGEVFGVVTGNKQQFGAPGLIGVDRVYKAAGALVSGDNTASAVMGLAPVLSTFLPYKAIGEALKDNKE